MTADKSDNISFKPSSDFDGRQPLNLASSKVLKSIPSLPFDDFCELYSVPPATREGYLDVRHVPELWWHVVSSFSLSHVFLYAYCLAERDDKLADLSKIRVEAYAKCDESGNEAGLLWLAMRPKYSMQLATAGRRKCIPAWNEQVKDWMIRLASDRGLLTARQVLIEYSIKAVLGSGADLTRWRSVLVKESENWEQWLTTEKAKISDFFNV